MQRVIRDTILILMLLVLASLQSATSYAKEDAQSIFDEGNKFFMDKEYGKACKNYEKLIGMGYKDASVYFNLSNSYILLGDPAKSVLNLERAKKIQPRSKDIQKNLHNLKAAIRQGSQEYEAKTKEHPLTIKKFIRSFDYISKNEISIAMVLLYLSFLVWAIIRKRVKSNKVRIMVGIMGMLSFLLTLSLIFLFVGTFYYDSFYPKGAIMKKTKLLSMPANGDDYKDALQLSEGTVIELIGSYNGYGEVTLESSSKTGWVKLDVVEKI